MKTKLISSLKKNVLLVDGLPENAVRLEVVRITNPNYISYTEGKTRWNHNLPDGDWNFLGKIKDLTEEQYTDLVHRYSKSPIYGFKNYKSEDEYFLHKKESFLSALEAKGLHLNGNPLWNKPRYDYQAPSEYPHDYYEHLEKWQEAEQNVFSENTLIFIEQ